MNIKRKLILFLVLLLLVTSSFSLSACSILSGESTSQQDSRITQLETEVKADEAAIAKLQQQVQAQAPTPSIASTTPTTPPVSTAPATTTTPPVSTAPTTPALLTSASVAFSNLTVTPAEVYPGDNVTVSIDVSNKGNIQGSYKVVLTEKTVSSSNILEYANLVTLNPGETKTVTFVTGKNQVGTYSVQVSDKVGQYTVIPVPPPPTTETTD